MNAKTLAGLHIQVQLCIASSSTGYILQSMHVVWSREVVHISEVKICYKYATFNQCHVVFAFCRGHAYLEGPVNRGATASPTHYHAHCSLNNELLQFQGGCMEGQHHSSFLIDANHQSSYNRLSIPLNKGNLVTCSSHLHNMPYAYKAYM